MLSRGDEKREVNRVRISVYEVRIDLLILIKTNLILVSYGYNVREKNSNLEILFVFVKIIGPIVVTILGFLTDQAEPTEGSYLSSTTTHQSP